MPQVAQKQNKTTEVFKYGIIDTIESRAIPRGAARRSLNWLTKGDHIELRRGSRFLGTSSVNTGLGKATGLKRATLPDGTEILFGTYGKKAKYFDNATEEWVEIGSNLLGDDVVDVNGYGKESIAIQEYVGLAGNQVFINSPNNAGFYKIMTANPGSYTDMYSSSKNFKGFIKIDTNSTFLWQRLADQTGLYRSYIDSQNYTTVPAEVIGTGTGSQSTFTNTLTFRAANPLNTCFGISVTDGVETFRDNYDGTLIGDAGGTGTINYTTGAISVTFASPVANSTNVTCSYQHENSNNGGITDFTKSTPRTAGQGFAVRQDEGGGKLQSVMSYDNVYYCMHVKRTWAFSVSIDDSTASNLPYRHKVGIPHDRAAVETGKGVYYIDQTDDNDVRIRLLTYDVSGSQQVIPVSISNNLDLSNYTFEEGVGAEYGDFILKAGRTKDSERNNRTLVYNKLFDSFDVLDYAVTCFDTFNGALVAGDSITDNFLELFSGYDDLDSVIFNYWEGKLDSLDIDGLKASKKFKILGAIGPSQKIKVSASIDNGPFVEVRSKEDAANNRYAIEGSGTYVDRSNRVTVGPVTLGRSTLGGGGNGIEAYYFEREFSLRVDKFEEIVFRFEAVEVGWASISAYACNDIRFKGVKTPRKYRG